MHLYIDTSNIAHVLAHSMQPQELQVGPQAIALGVTNMIGTYIRFFRADRVYFCFDGVEGSWRGKLCPEYKAQRAAKFKAKPEEQAKRKMADAALRLLPELVDLLCVPVFQMPWVEADDVCAAVVSLNANKPGVIVTSDKDFWQLITPSIHLMNPAHNYRVMLGSDGKLLKMKANGTNEEIGLSPNEWLLSRAMVGDTSDNLAGLIGCGNITARKVILEQRVNTYLAEKTGTVTKRKTKTTPKQEVYQDARAVVQKNLKMMTLLRSQVSAKVTEMMSLVEREGLRARQNNATRLTLWLESKGYANTEIVGNLVATYTDLWLR